MSNFTALNITVLPFAISSTELERMRKGSHIIDEILAERMPEIEDQNAYINAQSQRIPAGATVKLDDLMRSANDHGFREISFPLFVPHFVNNDEWMGHRYVLLFTDCMDGLLIRSGDSQRLHDASAFAKVSDTKFGRVYALDLSDCSVGILVYGEMTLLFDMGDVMSNFDLGALLGEGVVPPVELERYRMLQSLERYRAGQLTPEEEEDQRQAAQWIRNRMAPGPGQVTADVGSALGDKSAAKLPEEPVAEAQPIPPPLPHETDEPVEIDGEDLDQVPAALAEEPTTPSPYD
ncbi:hypothetical protein HZC53_01335 [Candidatus Uhrbacteria bacterium]|nr:hypothetical protein [Candidatus Uhrbacteria bacterium]